jgi:hypothetical protein
VRASEDYSTYPVHISQNEHGFRMFGNVHSQMPKILVIGDSFTQALEASDEKTYYGIVRRFFDWELFVYGALGYGTLQEYMILDKYFDVIQPDLVVWQYSTNDFINNDPDLESASKIHNNRTIRPYWRNRTVEYILPGTFRDTRNFALKYSRLMYWAISRLDKASAYYSDQSVERQIARRGPKHPGFQQAVRVTDELMGKVRARAGGVPIVAFIVQTGEAPFFSDALTDVSAHYGILVVDNVESALQSAEAEGLTTRTADRAHWNETGHRIAGEVITNYLRTSYAGLPAAASRD